MIPNKAAYMDNESWLKLVKILSPGIRKIKVSSDACVFLILLYIYIYNSPYLSLQILFI